MTANRLRAGDGERCEQEDENLRGGVLIDMQREGGVPMKVLGHAVPTALAPPAVSGPHVRHAKRGREGNEALSMVGGLGTMPGEFGGVGGHSPGGAPDRGPGQWQHVAPDLPELGRGKRLFRLRWHDNRALRKPRVCRHLADSG